jgi:pimeloyl-ACP methyl ester carboxylesterase
MNTTLLQKRELVVNDLRSPLLEGAPTGADPSQAVVFVHGNPGSSRDWAKLAEGVAGFARVVALDMPGFGQADKPEQFPYTVGGYGQHLGAALDTLGIRRAHLVLHDFGGPWGLAWAVAHPQALASVTLIDTGCLPGYSWHYLARIWRTPLLGEAFQALATRSAFRLLFKHGNPRGLPPEFIDGMYDDYDAGTRRAVLRLYRATSDIDGLSRKLAAALTPLRLPALVIWGRRDPYLGAQYAERQREVFADAQVHVLEDSGHWPFADNPEAVQALVLPFLRERVAQTMV